MGSKGKKSDKKEPKTTKVGFLPDFSLYLEKHFPIEEVYTKQPFINKLGEILKSIISEENPTFELQDRGLCNKAEKMDPKKDKDFFNKLSGIGARSATIYPYYLSFGNNGYGIVLYLDPSNRHAYFLALDIEHKIRRWHGKLG